MKQSVSNPFICKFRSHGCFISLIKISMVKNYIFLLLAISGPRYSPKFILLLCYQYTDTDTLILILMEWWQANFPSLESLIAKIHEDGKRAENALELPLYAKYKDEMYFKSIAHGQNSHLWPLFLWCFENWLSINSWY